MSHTPRPEPLSNEEDQQVLYELTRNHTAQEILRGLSLVYWAHRGGENDEGGLFDYLARELSETAEAIDENLKGPEGEAK